MTLSGSWRRRSGSAIATARGRGTTPLPNQAVTHTRVTSTAAASRRAHGSGGAAVMARASTRRAPTVAGCSTLTPARSVDILRSFGETQLHAGAGTPPVRLTEAAAMPRASAISRSLMPSTTVRGARRAARCARAVKAPATPLLFTGSGLCLRPTAALSSSTRRCNERVRRRQRRRTMRVTHGPKRLPSPSWAPPPGGDEALVRRTLGLEVADDERARRTRRSQWASTRPAKSSAGAWSPPLQSLVSVASVTPTRVSHRPVSFHWMSGARAGLFSAGTPVRQRSREVTQRRHRHRAGGGGDACSNIAAKHWISRAQFLRRVAKHV